MQSRIPISEFESKTLKTAPSPSKNPKFPLGTPPPMFLRAMPIPLSVVMLFIYWLKFLNGKNSYLYGSHVIGFFSVPPGVSTSGVFFYLKKYLEVTVYFCRFVGTKKIQHDTKRTNVRRTTNL